MIIEKHDGTVCTSCWNRNQRKNIINIYNDYNVEISGKQSTQRLKKVNTNNRSVICGTSGSGKTYLILKSFSRTSNRDVCIATKSPREHSINSEIQRKKIGEEIQFLSERSLEIETINNGGVVASDGMSYSRKDSEIDQLYKKVRYKILDGYIYLNYVLVYRDNAYKKLINEDFCLNRYSEMWKVNIKILEDLIWLLVNWKQCVVNRGANILSIFASIRIELKIKRKIALLLKAKTIRMNVYRKLSLLKWYYATLLIS